MQIRGRRYEERRPFPWKPRVAAIVSCVRVGPDPHCGMWGRVGKAEAGVCDITWDMTTDAARLLLMSLSPCTSETRLEL
jgi:hypothetical protein